MKNEESFFRQDQRGTRGEMRDELQYVFCLYNVNLSLAALFFNFQSNTGFAILKQDNFQKVTKLNYQRFIYKI